MNWIAYALLGAVAAGVTAVLSKVGVGNIPSNLAVLIRTGVVIVIAAAIVFARGEYTAFKDVKGTAWLALILSGASRTADVEKIIVRGIHGAEEMVVVLG